MAYYATLKVPMAFITLRSYKRFIKESILSGQFLQAVGHCREILKIYPKEVDTYRLYGETLLEMQRFTAAEEAFQRLLSAVPDDFVALVGMSVIKEETGSLDEAIWFTMQALDVQPANLAIKDELKRLYGKRDKVEPVKIPLTHLSLARLYLRGELYPQAIAEVKIALTAVPDRSDALLLLSQACLAAGQLAEAQLAASMVVKKLPYCLAANRILLYTAEKKVLAENLQTIQQRVYALDPYAQFAPQGTLDSNAVDEKAIILAWPGEFTLPEKDWLIDPAPLQAGSNQNI
jgi:tetratricopeptide (TPR) repeat protein